MWGGMRSTPGLQTPHTYYLLVPEKEKFEGLNEDILDILLLIHSSNQETIKGPAVPTSRGSRGDRLHSHCTAGFLLMFYEYILLLYHQSHSAFILN